MGSSCGRVVQMNGRKKGAGAMGRPRCCSQPLQRGQVGSAGGRPGRSCGTSERAGRPGPDTAGQRFDGRRRACQQGTVQHEVRAPGGQAMTRANSGRAPAGKVAIACGRRPGHRPGCWAIRDGAGETTADERLSRRRATVSAQGRSALHASSGHLQGHGHASDRTRQPCENSGGCGPEIATITALAGKCCAHAPSRASGNARGYPQLRKDPCG